MDRDDKDNKRRGIVVSQQAAEGYVYPMVLIFEDSFRTVRDFKMLPIVPENKKPEKSSADEVEERKPIKKEIPPSEQLIFGQMIQWDWKGANGECVQMVSEFRRVPSLYEARLLEGNTQILVQGMMSKNRKVLWMLGLWPDLEIPYHLQQDCHPNVVVDVWVTLQLMPRNILKYELHSFVGPAENFQHLATKAAWNSDDSGNLEILFDPIVGKRQHSEYSPTLSSTITGMHGIVISEKCIVAEEERHRDVCFHRVVASKSDRYPKVGSHVRFNAEKIDFLNIYAVKDVVNVAENTSLPLSPRGQVKTTIRHSPEHPGFYFSKSLGIYLDDPDNVLEDWLLSDYTKSTLQVAISTGEPSDKGTARYRITEILDAKAKKIVDLRLAGKLFLEDELAVVMEEGELHVPRLPKSELRLSTADCRKYPPGTVLRVSAVLEKNWRVKSAEPDRKLEPFPATSVNDEATEMDVVLFSVPELRGVKEFPVLLYSPIFGFVQTPRSFRPLRNPDREAYKDVWITLNDCHPGDVLLPPSKFKVFSVGELDVENENIAPYSSESSFVDVKHDVSVENPREFALNNAKVPHVNKQIEDVVFDDMMKTRGHDVPTMIVQLTSRSDWKKNPAGTMEMEIQKHLKSCSLCTESSLGHFCYFSEFLGLALQASPEIFSVLQKRNLLNWVYLRRFDE